MKIVGLFFSVFFISSCHINDTRPENHRATVSVSDGDVCIMLPDTKGESISLLSIGEVGSSENVLDKQFVTGGGPELKPNKCISNLDFVFKPGKSYVFSVNTVRISRDHTVKNGNSYSVTFFVWVDKGQLKVKDIN